MLFRDKIYNMESRHDPHPHDVPGIPEALGQVIVNAQKASAQELYDTQLALFGSVSPQKQDELGVVQTELAERIGKGTLDQAQ